jgi:hypothetical protein
MLSRQKVKTVAVHQVVHVPGVGQLKNTLAKSDLIGSDMTTTPEGVLVSYKGQSFVIPWGNISVAVFEKAPELPQPPTTSGGSKQPAKAAA